MFESFFPRPKVFFLSVVIYAGLCSFIWYTFNTQIGEILGFDLSPTKSIIGLGHFVTDSFQLFYLYYLTCCALFATFWFRLAPHPWQWWSIVGSMLILFSTYFSVQVSVAINNWRRPFFDLVQNALGGSASQEGDKIEIVKAQDAILSDASGMYDLILIFAQIAFLAIHGFCHSKFLRSSAISFSAGVPR